MRGLLLFQVLKVHLGYLSQILVFVLVTELFRLQLIRKGPTLFPIFRSSLTEKKDFLKTCVRYCGWEYLYTKSGWEHRGNCLKSSHQKYPRACPHYSYILENSNGLSGNVCSKVLFDNPNRQWSPPSLPPHTGHSSGAFGARAAVIYPPQHQ